MKILTNIQQTQKLTTLFRTKNKIIGFVPTMGYLHEGHLSLMKIARRKSDVLFASIFVNPLQFGKNEDLKAYPRDFDRDKKLCKNHRVDYVFFPNTKTIYNKDFSTMVNVENVSGCLEGLIRPGHFIGVATVVLKLLNIVQPHFSVFGQKDAQQVVVIKKMINDLNINTKLIVAPTVREKDGLAMSSRNVYLNPEQRKDAVCLFQALKLAEQKINKDYKGNVKYLIEMMTELILSFKNVSKIDYISFNDAETLKTCYELKPEKIKKKVLVSLAVRFGNIRLIDNMIIKY